MTIAARPIGERMFSEEDQQRFARLSHDFNPLHMDPVAARRLMTGRQVVHGIHIVLTGLEFWQSNTNQAPEFIRCTFNNPVSIGDRVVYAQCDDPGHKTSTVEAAVDGLVCATFTLVLPGALQASKPPVAHLPVSDVDLHIPTTFLQALDEVPEFHQGKAYGLQPDATDLSAYFSNSHRLLGNERLAATLALSYIVGMVCPGLHSVFSALNMDLCEKTAGDGLLRFSLRKYDPRFRLFNICFSGPIDGDIKAFLRLPVQSQPSVSDLSSHVLAHEFKGTRTLVIGGSRGLGEITAKILAAGGGDTVITYAQGLEDARAIGDEIEAGGAARCQIVRLDLSCDGFDSLPIDWETLDAIYFFATPRIFRKKFNVFDPRLFREFSDFYIVNFYELCLFLEKTLTTGRVKVYFPSTVFVEARPKGMTEYAMAKSAAEVLIEEINRSFTKLSVLCTRLPRLSTDQTASIVKVLTESNVGTLLPLIRRLNGACS